jgi:hypothetical protein
MSTPRKNIKVLLETGGRIMRELRTLELMKTINAFFTQEKHRMSIRKQGSSEMQNHK